ncbi:MAG: hypothetical protein L0220_28490, partial [Acidobacteria bacterium]|nr:hypothetical protein [Acidobacteriota bacterium]
MLEVNVLVREFSTVLRAPNVGVQAMRTPEWIGIRMLFEIKKGRLRRVVRLCRRVCMSLSVPEMGQFAVCHLMVVKETKEKLIAVCAGLAQTPDASSSVADWCSVEWD